MRFILNVVSTSLLLICLASCGTNKQKESKMDNKTILEVTTFNIDSTANPEAFAKRDATIESDFTSQQAGFIKRQSGLDDKGNYVVLVYWESIADADASMKKFMTDASVADYAKMIDASTMNMTRYEMDKAFEANDSRFVEVMSFNLQPETNMEAFETLNYKVETDFTGKRAGFRQRLIGNDENNRQIVVIYWENKELSDASLQAFMAAPIAKDFMQKMDQSSMAMGRYSLLNKD